MSINKHHDSWGLYTILRLEGEVYAVMQKWELWKATPYNGGGISMATIPAGDIRVVKLESLMSPGNKKALAEELL